jgi:ubiquinone/menaquinone biosynthesis C-methylase UbiE
LREMHRVLKSSGRLVFIPVKPGFVGSVLEFLYTFKIHPLESVRASARRYFNIVGN